MMKPEQSKAAFVQLGKVFESLSNQTDWPGFELGLSEEEYEKWQQLIETVHHHNGWFTPDNVRRALKAWSENLTEAQLSEWLKRYEPEQLQNSSPKKVGIVMAGNIPMVGFHDLLSVLMTGHQAVVKLSSDDNLLIPAVVRTLAQFEPDLEKQVIFADRLNEIDAVIATGSNNSSRYFEYYFSKMPHIIRKNRNSVAIVDDQMNSESLKAIGDDIFAFFGLGCRNVTKLYLPAGFDIDLFFKAIYDFHPLIEHNKYANNYDYHKALYLLNKEPLLDNGFVLLRKHTQLQSALGTLHYEYYNEPESVRAFLNQHENEIQCVVGDSSWEESVVKPGESQRPALWDYADDVDTIEFLSNL